jgi:hypothetical protein
MGDAARAWVEFAGAGKEQARSRLGDDPAA